MNRRDLLLLPPDQGGRADQGCPWSERCRHDLEAAGKWQPGSFVELVLGCSKERFTESKCDRSADDRQLQIAQGTNRSEGTADHHAGAFHDHGLSTLWRTTGLGLDGPAAAIGLQATLAPADTRPSVGLDNHMADVASVSDSSLQNLPSADNSATDSGAHDDTDEITDTNRSPAPGLGERQCPGVSVDGHWELQQLLQLAS